MKKDKLNITTAFESGDLCRNQNGDMFVILEVSKDGDYKFVNLQTSYINVIGDRIEIKKGSISNQPSCVFDKYNYLYQPK
jgi:hypothetical protein